LNSVLGDLFSMTALAAGFFTGLIAFRKTASAGDKAVTMDEPAMSAKTLDENNMTAKTQATEK
jgi:hypothetical protein